MSRCIWVTVAVTDRSAPLRALLADLHLQCQEVDVGLRILVVENSGLPGERERNRATAAWLGAEGRSVALLDAPPYRRSIADSRLRQRRWLEQELARGPAPTLIWMLDDDNRLEHLSQDGGVLSTRRLEHHVGRLLSLAEAPDRPDLLIGRVCGDPPIPPVATLASRLVDLEANLDVLLCARASTPAVEALEALPLAADFDAYYDFSHERAEPTWAQPRRWLPQDATSTCSDEARAMLAEAACLGQGVALARPILVDPAALSLIEPGYRRGGNAVFFDPSSCLDHRYPSLTIAGLQTRRGDMIGSTLLARRRRVRSGGFAVRHCRPRRPAFPSHAELVASAASDTLGAALARAITPDGAYLVDQFLDERTGRIEEALTTAVQAAKRLRTQLSSVHDHGLGEAVALVVRVLDWVCAELPVGPRGGGLNELLRSRAHRGMIEATARDLQDVLERVA